MIKTCIECENEAKYKCPRCQTQNCSVKCFKAHKESGRCDREYEEIINNERLQQETSIEDKTPTMAHVFTTIDTVPIEKLEKLKDSEHLKNLLANPHLRRFIREVHSSRNPSNAMKVAMQEPLFVEFSDECMKIVDPSDDFERTDNNE